MDSHMKMRCGISSIRFHIQQLVENRNKYHQQMVPCHWHYHNISTFHFFFSSFFSFALYAHIFLHIFGITIELDTFSVQSINISRLFLFLICGGEGVEYRSHSQLVCSRISTNRMKCDLTNHTTYFRHTKKPLRFDALKGSEAQYPSCFNLMTFNIGWWRFCVLFS